MRLPIRRAVLVAGVGLAMASPGVLADPQDRSRKPIVVSLEVERGILETLQAYAAGDDLAVSRWLVVSSPLMKRDVERALLQSTWAWSRARAAFLIELAASDPMRFSRLLGSGRALVMSRPSPLGADPAEDRFELLWHHIAIGATQFLPNVALQDEYLAGVSRRLDEAQRLGVVFESRVPLARAFTAAILCCWKAVSGEIIRVNSRSVRTVTLHDALKLFEQAAEVPAFRAEALIRGGRLLYETGRPVEALAWFERVPEHRDPLLGYVHRTAQGHILGPMSRPADAALAYEAALRYIPNDPKASLGLAAALLRAGRPEESARAVPDARPANSERATYLSDFRRGDHRHIARWLTELRTLRR